MTLTGGGAIANDVLKFRKVIEFESSCIEICFSYIYLIIDRKRLSINKIISHKMVKHTQSQTLSVFGHFVTLALKGLRK